MDSNGDHWEIFPSKESEEHSEPGYMFRFQFANGDIGPVSMQRYRDRSDANRGIHDFLEAVGNCDGPHPPIIDVEE